MGVPAFYRWLTKKYPNVVEVVKEDKCCSDTTAPNPNGFEYDHLYLDMNGIIHPCFHPDSLIFPPTTFNEVFENIYAYIDRLFSIVRPRKLLYLAIDGVAPRAKLNQQRTRRFRTAKDNELAEKEEKRLREKYERMGKRVLPVVESQVSDSNVITPGTEFMFQLSNALKSYIMKRLETDPGWRQIKVVLSDATVPGEGEHKIMSFIRTLRALPDYDPNTRHCLYGLDADLIMLALATHEVHFSILREDVSKVPDQKPDSESSLQITIQRAVAEMHALDRSTEQGKKWLNIQDKSQSMAILPQQYQFLHVWILREYLEFDMQIIDPPDKFEFDVERIIDDFVFMCFFMGNDFLPHMPTLDIREDGIDLLMHVYKNELKSIGGYLVDMQRVNDPNVSFIKLKRVEKFILSVGSYEDKVFKKRIGLREAWERRILSSFKESREDEDDEQSSDVCITDDQCPKAFPCADVSCNSISDINEMVENTRMLKEELKKCIRKNSDIFKDGIITSDKIKLGSAGWKLRYYKEKFCVEDPKEIEILRKETVQKFTEGLCWVLMYYYSGIPSWNWYYPDYYGLFASEMKGLAQVKVKFHKGSPFKPFDQLMAVLPPKSAHALPEAYRDLMTNSDSEIAEFYPKVFEVDTDGKRFLWQGICKLTFIDEVKLLNATCQLESKIKEHEAQRNVEGSDHLFWRSSKSLDYIVQHSDKMEEFQHDVNEEPIMCCKFNLPVANLKAPRPLEGVQLPEKTVFEGDITETFLWHECKGKPPVTRSKVRAPQPHNRAADDQSVQYKEAGSGWSGAGRGKGNSSNFSESYTNTSENHQSSPGSRGWFKQHPTSVVNINRRMESLKLTPSETNNWRGRETTRPNQNGSFWPSSSPNVHRNATWQGQRPTWRPSNAYPSSPNPGNGRGCERGSAPGNYENAAWQYQRQRPAWRPALNQNPSWPTPDSGIPGRQGGLPGNPQNNPVWRCQRPALRPALNDDPKWPSLGNGRGHGQGRGYYRHDTDHQRPSQDRNRW